MATTAKKFFTRCPRVLGFDLDGPLFSTGLGLSISPQCLHFIAFSWISSAQKGQVVNQITPGNRKASPGLMLCRVRRVMGLAQLIDSQLVNMEA
jgi:hypothetical protein